MKASNNLTKNIIKYCALQGHYVVRINNIPGTKFRKNTLTRGVADIMGCTKEGIALAIEVKIGKDKQSEFQKTFENHYKNRGGVYILANELKDVTEKI
jgi:hypothetical protein